jgi:thiol:disulfide interchange protein DsbD
MDQVLVALELEVENILGEGLLVALPVLFLIGVLTSFTPCTYPMLPVAVGYIGAASDRKRFAGLALGLAMAVGMAFVYAVVGTVLAAMHLTFGALAGEGVVWYGVAVLFLVMGLFLLDAIHFPHLDFAPQLLRRAARRRSLLGALTAGMAGGLVVGPCTGPVLFAVIGFLVATLESTGSGLEYAAELLRSALLLFAFGLGQGALIVICGTAAGVMSRLPKSGPWLVAVRRSFAVVLLLMSTLLLLHAGAVTGFDPLGRVLTAAERRYDADAADAPRRRDPPAAAPEGPYGDEEFLE